MHPTMLRFNAILFRVFTCLFISFLLSHPGFASGKASAPPLVALVLPADGSTIYASAEQPKALPRFTWNPVAGATAYRLEISADEGFTPSALLVEVPATPANTWTPVDANLPDGVLLYWRVRVEGQTGTTEKGEYSTATFRKDWRKIGPDGSAPNTVSLLLPEDGAALAFNDPPAGGARPGFSWTPALGATHYLLQFSPESDFDPLAHQETTTSTMLQTSAKLADGEYYWRVIPMQAGDPPLKGDPGESRQVTFDYHTRFLPQLLEPADQAVVEFHPTFRWSAVRGAQKYVLQYSPDAGFPAEQTTQVETFASRYTPPELLKNHTRYFWRVRVVSGSSGAVVWTPAFSFERDWSEKPALLTPANDFLYANDPYFSWAPVPGAAAYTLEVDDNAAFTSPLTAQEIRVPFYAFTAPVHNCPPYTPDGTLPEPDRVFWRVTPQDAGGQSGAPSDTWTFICDSAAGAPVQVYPEMYSPPASGPELNPRRDPTAPLPVFLWKRVVTGAEQAQAAAYRIQVADAPDFAPESIRYTWDTENPQAVPAQAGLLPHGGGQIDYFWRVRTLKGLGGAEDGPWSQVWRMRYNPDLLPAAVDVIQPLSPAEGSEWVEMVPLFEWMPLKGATAYRIELGLDRTFQASLGTFTVDFPVYSHPHRLAAGTYYWRVLGTNGPGQVGEWSQPVRFHVAAQSRWRPSRTLGANASPVIATDPPGDAGADMYDLTALSVTQGGANWYIGIQTTPGGAAGETVRYGVYIDTDRIPDSGGTYDPKGNRFTADSVHLPEFVVYISKVNGSVNPADVLTYRWNPDFVGWNNAVRLTDLNGAGITYNNAAGYMEFTIANLALPQGSGKNSLAVAVVSLPAGVGLPLDSLPHDPNIVPGGSQSGRLSRFASVSDRVNQVMSPYLAKRAGLHYATAPALVWHPPVEVPDVASYNLRFGVDPGLNTWLSTALQNRAAVFTFPQEVGENAVYYWQVRPVYTTGSAQGGWSQAGSFERSGMPAQGLQVAEELWTPYLAWDLAEGAYSYFVEIDDDAGFTPPLVLSATTKVNTFTPDAATFIDEKTYYARIRTNQTPAIKNPVSAPISFSVPAPAPTGLHTLPETSPGSPALANPTLCWEPVGPAWKYLVEVSRDASFAPITADALTEQRCFTFQSGLPDGEFFWRVRAVDGSLKNGLPSTASRYWKRYPAPDLITPLGDDGAGNNGTPLFIWSPVEGADRYVLEISDTRNFAVIRYRVSTVNSEHQPVEPLNFARYYWRVKMIDRDGIAGPFSDDFPVYNAFLPAVRK